MIKPYLKVITLAMVLCLFVFLFINYIILLMQCNHGHLQGWLDYKFSLSHYTINMVVILFNILVP
jgi:hypothetical protein